MSYCRFENTQNALADCLDSLDDKPFSDLSKDEQLAARAMAETAERIMCALKDQIEDAEYKENHPDEEE